MMHVASSQRLHGSEAKDSQFNSVRCGIVKVGPNYSSLDIIFLLTHRGILVFFFTINRTPRVGGEANIQPDVFSRTSLTIDRTQDRTCPPDSFQPDVCSLF
jgi:hypothetical protein